MNIGDEVYVGGSQKDVVTGVCLDGRVNLESEGALLFFGISPERLSLQKRVSSGPGVPFEIIEEDKPFRPKSSEKSSATRKRSRLHEPVPAVIDTTLLNFLKLANDSGSVHIRIHWGHLIDDEVREFFQKVNLTDQTKHIRALKSDMYGIAGTVWFPAPPSFLMSKFSLLYKESDGVIEVNNVDFALGLVLLGFTIDRGAKHE